MKGLLSVSLLTSILVVVVSFGASAVPTFAHRPGYAITVFRCMTLPTVNGAWGPGEWDDAEQRTMFVNTGSGSAFFRMKTCQRPDVGNEWFLYVIIDFVSDPDLTSSVNERADIQLDLAHNGGTAPQTDDLWFHLDGLSTPPTPIRRGGGGGWSATPEAGWAWGTDYAWVHGLSASPNSAAPHHVYEFLVRWNKLIDSTPGASTTVHGFVVIAYRDASGSISILGYPETEFQNPNQWADANYSATVIPEFSDMRTIGVVVMVATAVTLVATRRRSHSK